VATSSKTLRIQVKRRRFGFKCGLSAVGVKEYQKKRGGVALSFAVALDAEREAREVRKLVRTEILKRITR
jgi:hypothetical protein